MTTLTDVDCTTHCVHGDDVDRDKKDRPLVDGVPYERISNLSKALDDGFNLIDYQCRLVAYGMSGSNAEHLREAALAWGLDDKKHLNEVHAEAALLAGAGAASQRGTALHAHVATLNRGLELPAGLSVTTMRSLAAYQEMLEQHGLTPVYVEQFVVNENACAAGTFDVALVDRSGQLIMGDVKTGAKQWERKFPGATAIQVSTYADGRRWCPVHGYLDNGALPVRPDKGLLISLPVDTGECHLTILDLNAGRRGLALAQQVRLWKSTQWRLKEEVR